MKRKFIIVPLFVVAILLLSGMPRFSTNGVAASRLRPGKIKGQVSDVHKARVVKALVIVESNHFPRKLLTNDKGEFEMSLPPGLYRVWVDANGFRRFVSREFELKSGETQRLNIELTIAKPSMLVPAVSDPSTEN